MNLLSKFHLKILKTKGGDTFLSKKGCRSLFNTKIIQSYIQTDMAYNGHNPRMSLKKVRRSLTNLVEIITFCVCGGWSPSIHPYGKRALFSSVNFVAYEGGRSHRPSLVWGWCCKTIHELPRHKATDKRCHRFEVTVLLSCPELSAKHAASRLMKAVPSGSQPP